MVRFKCRYLLVQIHTWQIDFLNEGLSNSSSKRLRYSHQQVENEQELLLQQQSPHTTAQPINLPFSAASVVNTLKGEMERNYGVMGGSGFTLGFSVKYTNTATRMIIIRCPRDWVARVQTCLALLSRFPLAPEKPELEAVAEGCRCTWRLVKCTGTIKACQRAAISFARSEIKDLKMVEEIVGKISSALD